MVVEMALSTRPHPPPPPPLLPVSSPASAHRLLLFSPAHLILYTDLCSNCFLLHVAVNIHPLLILTLFSFCFLPYNSVSPLLPFLLSPLTGPFALYFTPSVNTSSSSSGRRFDKKVEEQGRKGMHSRYTCISCAHGSVR